MPKRKKYPALPNGYGSIRYLGKNRKNCYAVHPPSSQMNAKGQYVRPKAICYVDDWYVGFAVLNAYRAGTYNPGDEIKFKQYKDVSSSDLDMFCSRILSDFTKHVHAEDAKAEDFPTFEDVYNEFWEWKYGEKASKKLSTQSRNSTKAAFKNSSQLHKRIFKDITVTDMQRVLDECELKEASIENIKSLFTQMYRFALPRKYTDMNYALGLVMPDAEGDEEGVPFTDDELKILWENKDKPYVDFILIMCYSGFRITAYKTITVNLDDWYFYGGIKTKNGKERYVPIHTAIRELVVQRIEREGSILSIAPATYRKHMYEALDALGISRHTPHDCRHTFSALLEHYKANENDRHRLLGHSLGNDITNSVYGHRTVEELRVEVEKIMVPYL